RMAERRRVADDTFTDRDRTRLEPGGQFQNMGNQLSLRERAEKTAAQRFQFARELKRQLDAPRRFRGRHRREHFAVIASGAVVRSSGAGMLERVTQVRDELVKFAHRYARDTLAAGAALAVPDEARRALRRRVNFGAGKSRTRVQLLNGGGIHLRYPRRAKGQSASAASLPIKRIVFGRFARRAKRSTPSRARSAARGHFGSGNADLPSLALPAGSFQRRGSRVRGTSLFTGPLSRHAPRNGDVNGHPAPRAPKQ